MESVNWTSPSEECILLDELYSGPPTYLITSLYAVVVLLALLSCLCIIANITVIHLILTTRQLHTNTNFLLFWLAGVDVAVGVVTCPLYIAFAFTAIAGSPCCLCLRWGRITHMGFSGFSMVTNYAVTVERAIAIFRPYQYPEWVNKQRMTAFLLVGWLILVVYMGASNKQLKDMNPSDQTYQYVTAVLIGLQLIFSTVVYWKIFRLTRKHIQRIASDQQPAGQGNQIQKESKVSKTTAIILGFLYASYLPMMIIFIIQATSPKTLEVSLLHVLFGWGLLTAILSPTLNPFIYTLRSKDAKNALKEKFLMMFINKGFSCLGRFISSTKQHSDFYLRVYDQSTM